MEKNQTAAGMLKELPGSSSEQEKFLLQSIMDGARNCHLAFLDKDFNFVLVNEIYACMCGHRREELIGRNHFDLFPNSDNEEIFKKVRDTGIPVEFNDKPFLHAHQPERGVTYWNWTFAPVKGPSGQVMGFVLSLFETTKRKRAEIALSESEARFRMFMDNSPTLNWIKDEEGRYVYLSRKFESRFGIRNKDYMGRTDMESLPGDIAISFRKSDLAVLESNAPINFIEEIAKSDGTDSYWLSTKFPFTDSSEKRYVAGIALDVTEYRQAEEALKKSEATLKSIFRAAPSGIGLIRNRVISWTNDRISKMVGYSQDELAGMSTRIFYENDREYERVGTEKYDEIRRKGTGAVETRWVRKEGGIIDIHLSSTPLDVNDLGAGVVFTALDITARKRAEEALRKSEEDLRRTNDELDRKVRERTAALVAAMDELKKSRDALRKLSAEMVLAEERERKKISMALHDEVAQSLAAIRLRIEMLQNFRSKKREYDSIVRDAKELITESITQTRSLMSDLINPVLYELGLKAAIQQYAEQISKAGGISVAFSLQGDLALTQDMNVTIYQITKELLKNIVKHSEAKVVKLRLIGKERGVELTVSDDGRGFDPRQIRLPDRESGFGLFSIRERVNFYNGSFLIRSGPGKGTSIRIELPIL